MIPSSRAENEKNWNASIIIMKYILYSKNTKRKFIKYLETNHKLSAKSHGNK